MSNITQCRDKNELNHLESYKDIKLKIARLVQWHLRHCLSKGREMISDSTLKVKPLLLQICFSFIVIFSKKVS